MKIISKIIKFIAITILTICITAITVIAVFSSTILDKDYTLNKLEENDYYHETYELVKSNFENYIYQSGLDEEVLNDIITEEKVKQDVNIIITNIYEGKDEKIYTTAIEQNLNKNIEATGAKTSKNLQAIQKFVETICNEYKDTIIHTEYETQINKIYKTATETIQLAYILIFVVIVISLFIILIANIKKMSSNFQDIGITLFATSMLELISCKIINSKVNIVGIKVFNDTFSKTIVSIITEVISKITSLATILLIAGIVLILLYALIVAVKTKEEKAE